MLQKRDVLVIHKVLYLEHIDTVRIIKTTWSCKIYQTVQLPVFQLTSKKLFIVGKKSHYLRGTGTI